jgi:hypothetical protein
MLTMSIWRPAVAVLVLAGVLGVAGCGTVGSGDATSPSASEDAAAAGFPVVSFGANGVPVVVIPETDPPVQTSLDVLQPGEGATVQDTDTVTVQYQGVNWSTGDVFDQSYGGEPVSFSTDGVIEGFRKALVGQKVGAQILAVIPPADGYGASGQPSAGISGTDTLVFVIDILDTTPTP